MIASLCMNMHEHSDMNVPSGSSVEHDIHFLGDEQLICDCESQWHSVLPALSLSFCPKLSNHVGMIIVNNNG